MKALIHIRLKKGVLDPQGRAITHALHNLGFNQVLGARQGKVIELELQQSEYMDHDSAYELTHSMCKKLLANDVIENFEIEILDPNR